MSTNATIDSRDRDLTDTKVPILKNKEGYPSWREFIVQLATTMKMLPTLTRPMTAEKWKTLSDLVESWIVEASDDLDDLFFSIATKAVSSSPPSGTGSSTPTSSSGSTTPKYTEDQKKQMIDRVTQCQKLYRLIYNSLTLETRVLIGRDILTGHVYALWKWVEEQFQPTASDNIGEIFMKFFHSFQGKDQSFDEWRAWVNELRRVLESAGQTITPEMYVWVLLDKLQPRHEQAVLALKASGKLTDKKIVDWNEIATFINTQERSKNRQESDGVVSAAWANAATSSRAAVPRTYSGNSNNRSNESSDSNGSKKIVTVNMDEIQCGNCRDYGHVAKVCPKPETEKFKQWRNRGKSTNSKSKSTSGNSTNRVNSVITADPIGDVKNNQYFPLSGDEEEIEEGKTNHIQHVVHALSVSVRPAAGATVERACPVTVTATSAQGELVCPAIVTTRNYLAAAKKKSVTAEQAIAARPPGPIVAKKPPPPDPVLQSKPKIFSQLDAALRDNAWGFDTMASVSVTGNKNQLLSTRRCVPFDIKTADGTMIPVNTVGTVTLRVNSKDGRVVLVKVENVYYNERFSSNLLSGVALAKLGWKFQIDENGSTATTPGGYTVPVSTRGNIAVLLPASPERVLAVQQILTGNTRRVEPDVEKLFKLHKRMAHQSFDTMIKSLSQGKVSGFRINLNPATTAEARKRVMECKDCCRGKQSRPSFGHRGLVRGQKPAEHLHMDTYIIRCDNKVGIEEVQYGVIMVDTYSGEVTQFCTKSKADIAVGVINKIKEIERQWNSKVKMIFSDGGTEFINHTLLDWLKNEGIVNQVSPPYTQQLNGVAERNIRTVKDLGRTILLGAGAPQWMWQKALQHAVWVLNRTRVTNPTGMTVYEQMKGRLPSFSEKHVGTWGCNAWVHQRKESRPGAMSSKSEPGIYVGHRNEYAVILMLHNQKEVEVQGARFHCDNFSHMKALVKGDDAINLILDNEEPEWTDFDAFGEPVQSGFTSSDAVQGGNEVVPPLADDTHDRASTPVSGTDSAGASSSGAPSDDENDPNKEYEVESILAHTGKGRNIQYLVRWKGDYENTWEPPASFKSNSTVTKYKNGNTVEMKDNTLLDVPNSSVSDVDAGSDGTTTDVTGTGNRVEMCMSAMLVSQRDEVNPTRMDELHRAIVAAVTLGEPIPPKSFNQLRKLSTEEQKPWLAARKVEYDACISTETWEEVPKSKLPKGTRVLPLKEIYTLKVDQNGKVERHKVRFTPCGNFQTPDTYSETYARTGSYKGFRAGLSIAAKFNHEIVQFDVPTAFLNAPLDEGEVIYMTMPPGLGKDDKVCRLKKSLYGLKQSPRNWDRMIHAFIKEEMKWTPTASDQSIYYKRTKSGRLMMLYRFVDDLQGQFHSEDRKEFELDTGMLRDRFKLKQMQTATWMLGMRITRDRKLKTITLDQEQYINGAVEKFLGKEVKKVNTPEVVGYMHDTNPAVLVPTDRQRYMEIVGTLMYAAISTRPDISHSVHSLASQMQNPLVRDMNAAVRVLRYLSGTAKLGLVFGSKNPTHVGDTRGFSTKMDVSAFADADWANDRTDRKSVSGWISKLNGDPISWSCKKQRVVSLSTAEAELYAEAAAIQETLWLRGLIKELGLHLNSSSIIYGDNQAAISISKNGIKGDRTKHVDIKWNFVTDTVESKEIELKWIPTTEMEADIFTKALLPKIFERLRAMIMTR
jgi:hypothetical protein